MAENKTNGYMAFMESESELSTKEQAAYGYVKEVQELMRMISTKVEPSQVKDYISKNLNTLFTYAPHMTLQIYLAIKIANNELYDFNSDLETLLHRPDLPAKAYSVVSSYMNVLQNQMENPTSISPAEMAGDDKILELLKNMSPDKINKLVFALSYRLQTGADMDHFVNLLNPYFSTPNNETVFKLSLLQQLLNLSSKYKATKPFLLNVNDEIYEILMDGSFDSSSDSFLRAIDYYGKSLNLPYNLNAMLQSFASMYRIIHLNQPKVLSSELGIKSFSARLIEAYNQSMSLFSKNSVFPYTYPEEYKQEYGYKEADKFINIIFKPMY